MLSLLSPSLCFTAGESALHDLYYGDAAQKIIKDFESYGRAQNYNELYALLHSDYTRNIKREIFSGQLAKAHFRILQIDATNIHWFESSGYMIVIYSWEKDGGKKEATEVVFFAKESGVLKLLNFPFAYGVVPNFTEEPCLTNNRQPK